MDFDYNSAYQLGLVGYNVGKYGYRAYKYLNSGKMPYLRGSKRLRRTSRVKRGYMRRTPSYPRGEGYVVPMNVRLGRKKKMTFNQRVARTSYPPIVINDKQVGGVESASPNQGTVTHPLGLNNATLQSFMLKVRDYYSTNRGLADESLPTSADGNMRWMERLQFKIDKISFKISFLNSATSTCKLQVYIVTPNREIVGTPNYANPLDWWEHCNDAATNATNNESPLTGTVQPDGLPSTWLGDKPDKSSTRWEFARWWRIVKKTSRNLEPGKMFNVNMDINKNGALWGADVHQYTQLPNYSYHMILIVNGQVVNGNIAGFSDMSVADAQVGYIVDRKVTLSYVSHQRPKSIAFSQLPTVASTNQRFVNEDELALDNYAEL